MRETGVPGQGQGRKETTVVAGWPSRGSGPGQGGRAHPDGTSHGPLCPGWWLGGQGPELEGEKAGGGVGPDKSPRDHPPRPPDTVSCSPWGIFLLGAWGSPPQFQNPGEGAD